MNWFQKKTTPDNGRFNQNINRQSIIIHHYCPHTYNAGDHFVIRSIRKHINENLPEAIFIPKPSAFNRGWGKPVRLTGKNLEFSNLNADAVIVGGSDQYNNWSLRIQKKEIGKLIPPLYLLGLGISSKSLNSDAHIMKKSYLEDIRVANETARMSSVRDIFTNEFLKKTGFTKAVVTGCPALYLFDNPFHFQKNKPVALTFPYPLLLKKNDPRLNNILTTIFFIKDLLNKLSLNYIIVCHDDRDVSAATQLFPEEKIFFSNYVDDYFELYKNISFVMGSRLHASIFAAGMGIPFININLDARGKGFSETFGLNEWNLDIDDLQINRKIKMRIEQVLSDDLSVFHNFHKVKSGYKKVFNNFIGRLAEDIRVNLKK